MRTLVMIAFAAVVLSQGAVARAQPKSLVERLGYPADAKLLIINADDFGMNHATNQAAIRAYRAGTVSSFTILVPCPWFPEVVEFARKNPQAPMGVHLDLNSEWKLYKWGPVAGRGAVPSLVDDLGYFPSDLKIVRERATPADVETELRAQIDRAIKAGIDVDHVDSHMMALMVTNPKLYEVLLKLAEDYKLPVRFNWSDLRKMKSHQYLIPMIEKSGVLSPDEVTGVGSPNTEETERSWVAALGRLPAGKVTEYIVHLGQQTAEMQASAEDWLNRSADADALMSARVRDALKANNVHLVNYRELRALQRTGKPLPRPPAAPVHP